MTRGTFIGGLIVWLLGASSVVAGQSSIVVNGPSKTMERRSTIDDGRSMEDRLASLAKAVQQLDRPTIQRLLQQRIDVNAPQVDGTTALHWAAYHDDLELVKRLLDAGAGVRASNRYGMTPLSLA